MQALSPKMKMMYGKEEKGFKKGYYGPLNFFNTQHDFHIVFGLKPTMLSSNPMGLSNNGVKEKLRKYGESCKMDVYLYLCEQDYVGED